MAWKKLDGLLNKRLNQKGLGAAVIAGQVCKQAETLYPDLFKAVSLRDGILRLEVSKRNLLAFKQVEGKLIRELNAFSKERRLPEVTRIRLTFGE